MIGKGEKNRVLLGERVIILYKISSEGGERAGHADIQRKSILGGWDSKCKVMRQGHTQYV